jgi:hypothetical protein
MATSAEPTLTCDRTPDRPPGPPGGRPMTAASATRRTVHTLTGAPRLNLPIRRGHTPRGAAHKTPYRPEAEGAVARPRHEFGRDVIARIGRLRSADAG